MSKYLAVDFEGDAGERGLLAMSWSDGDSAGYTEDYDVMRETLIDHASRQGDFLCHNAEYDIAVGFWQLGIPIEIDMYNGRFHHGQWRINRKGRMPRVWDTASLSAFSKLENLGPKLGLPKLPTPQRLLGTDVNQYQWQCERHGAWECLECYAVRDAEITHAFFRFYLEFCERFLIKPRHTLGSTAVALWRTLDNPSDVAILSPRVESLARAAFRGGRVELLKPGYHAPVYEYDVNSMYPFVMLTKPMPDMRHIRYRENTSIDQAVFDFEGVSEIECTVPKTYLPVLGVINNGFAYYPIGNLTGAWTHAEIRAAKLRGLVVHRVLRSVWSEVTCYPFTHFVETLWELKQEFEQAEDPRREVVKIMLNALYGRMGLSRGQTRRRVRLLNKQDNPKNLQGWEIHPTPSVVYLSRDYEMHKLSKDANVLWAAHITAYARLELLKHMEAAGRYLIYCDTDSVISQMPLDELPTQLGTLTAKGEWLSGRFLAPKLYELTPVHGSAQTKAKGVPQSVAAEYLAHGQASYKRPTRLLEALSRGLTAGSWVEVSKTRMLTPGRRQPLTDPTQLDSTAWVDTSPLWFELSDCELPDADLDERASE